MVGRERDKCMTFGMAAVLLILIIAGIILAVRGLQQRKILCIIIIVLLSVFGLALQFTWD